MVIWQAKAEKQWRKIGDRKIQGRILDAIESLGQWPNCSQVKPLSNHTYDYRLRTGDWRIMFNIMDGEPVIISIEEVKKRDERTY